MGRRIGVLLHYLAFCRCSRIAKWTWPEWASLNKQHMHRKRVFDAGLLALLSTRSISGIMRTSHQCHLGPFLLARSDCLVHRYFLKLAVVQGLLLSSSFSWHLHLPNQVGVKCSVVASPGVHCETGLFGRG